MAPKEPIAIVGSACRFPGGSNSPSKLWDLLRNPRDVLRKIPLNRFDPEGFHHDDPSFPGHANVKHSHMLDDNIAQFDAQFFNIKPDESLAMDPQQRLLLETVYEGLDAAGFTIEGMKGSDTGVYVGLMFGDYEVMQLRDLQSFPTYHATGTARSIVSNRVSYFYDWHGPSLTVDTACSSSLVAVHQGVQALRSGEVQVALAAGTNIILGPEPYVSESKLKMLSPDGRSRMWDADANGYARGEGVAAVFMKTLSAAIADGDNIECIIRETGVNQDGRSRGITMPSATAQATLIRETYARAGLDVTKDRCQYFEAHGTGTPAGDPVEAEAVHTAFFGHKIPGDEKESSPLFVGSIKTIVGHTESTAGLAGVLKVAQALKHGFIPPNRLLNRLNPDVLPFYDHLQIPQELTPWPKLPPGQKRRASVNSFGFGGTNAHAILENYEPPENKSSVLSLFSPFVFSAQSKQSLVANLRVHAEYLKQHPETNPADLSWTLRSRRSRLPLRVSFPASTLEELRSSLEELSNNFQLEPKSAAKGDRELKLLGVFTGQGAQWARMGAELVESSEYAAKILADLDESLAQLPNGDRPAITMRQELLEEAATSRVGKASVSQPLCTAVQIILVQLLQQAGIHFTAVVGHSSGEIAAAYTAGYFSASDAIRVAYYRGLHAHLAAGPNNCQGAMLAVGTTQEDAEELCNDEQFQGKVKLAACNSPASVSLSGDEEAIDEISVLFEDEGKFVRKLRVDKAYHSHHMLRCSQAYVDSIKNITARAHTSEKTCTWVSSVYPNRSPDEMKELDASYWVENMVSPVLFRQAVERATSLGPFDGAVEVGPHPALKGPVRETLQSLKIDMPYTGLLQRNTNAIKSISTAFGYLWTHVDNLDIKFDRYEQAVSGQASYHFISDLPAYQWNHSQEYWHESPLSRGLRQRSNTVHPLLGDLSAHSSPNHLTWKHVLRPKDLPWVHGHQVQGQTVFPAAGYASTALETVPYVAGDSPVQLVEIENMFIHQAMVMDNENEEAGIDIQFSLDHVNRDDATVITAHFTYEAAIGNRGSWGLIASGQLRISIGDPSPELLPASTSDEPYMIPVTQDEFYSSLEEVGYGYSGPFRALGDIRRKLWKASGSLEVIKDESTDKTYTVHPGCLDAAFHAVILALSYPQDGQLWSMHIPTSIQRIRFNPALCGRYWKSNGRVPFLASAQDPSVGSGFQGDAEVHSIDGQFSAIQVEGIKVVPLADATSADDKPLFHAMHWFDAEPNADTPGAYKATAEQTELACLLERGSIFYLRELEKQIPADHPGRSDKYNAAYLEFAAHTDRLCREGKHRYAKKEWLKDTVEDIIASAKPYADLPEVKAMHIVGEHMPRSIRGETMILEHLLMTGLLDEYYAKALGYRQVSEALADTVQQIARRYPNMNILEVGAGTGGATNMILDRIGRNFSSYTFTDVSTGFFGNAQEKFSSYKDQMTYTVLDLEQDMQSQGLKKHSYDLVISSLVVHATKSIEETMRRVRSLLKPGGYLVMTECTNLECTRVSALFGTLPAWWLGVDEGRKWGPSITESEWDTVLRKVGFSGIDTMTPTDDGLALVNSVLVTQAVNDWVEFIREPLLAQSSLFVGRLVIDNLFVVGGSSFRNTRLINEIQKLIGVFCENVTKVKAIEALDHSKIDSKSTVLVLQDLDQPVFQDITHERFESLKTLFGSEKTIIWVTQNRFVDHPYSNMPVGFARSTLWEVPELRYQFVDFEGVHRIDARVLAETVLRFQAAGSSREQNQRNALWSVEQEVVIDSDGRQRVPRLMPFGEANDRYNSTRRKITKEVHAQISPIAISRENGCYVISQQPTLPSTSLDKTIRLKLSHTSSRAIKTTAGDAFVVLGNCTSTGAQHLGLTQFPASLVDISKAALIPCSVPSQSEAIFVGLVAANLLSPVLTDGLGRGDTLLVNDAPPMVATLLTRQASPQGIRLVYTSFSRKEAKSNGWLHVDRYIRQSHLKSLLPNKITRFVDFTNLDRHNARPSPISSCLPAYIPTINTSSMFPQVASSLSSDLAVDSASAEVLTIAMHAALGDLSALPHDSTVSGRINVQKLPEEDACEPLTVIEWAASSVPVAVEPVKSQFRPDRTYWLVGLTGDMGISITNWMIKSGARYLISDTMPPVAGVAQGAMVLVDVATRDMTLDQLNRVLRPKVEGSLNLDRLFQDQSLDFFIFFSSTASVTGNPGQANYCSANLFMCGLAHQRRRRGLAASVMDLGAVLGTGYITRERKADFGAQQVMERGFYTLSEFDVHHTVSEAINASRPDSGPESHISTGLRPMAATDPNRLPWCSYPQFGHLTLRDSEGEMNTGKGQEGASICEQLVSATTKDEVRRIVTESFTADLRTMLQLGDDYEVTTSARTDELGLDSLVAVRIRSWFLNNFQVNIPALRILKGVSIQELIDQALETMPQTLTPNVGNSGHAAQSSSEQATTSDSSSDRSDGRDTPPSTYSQSHDSAEWIAADEKAKEYSSQKMQFTRFGDLSYTQSMFLFAHRLLNDTTTLNNSGLLHLQGDLRMSGLKQAIETIAQRHEILRTCFVERDGQIVQGITDSSPLTLEYKKIYNQQELFAEYESLKKHEFDLARGHTIRLILLSYSPRDHYLMVGYHHIILDRGSHDAFMIYLEQLYHGQDSQKQPVQYLDHSNWQHEQYSSGNWKDMTDFWRREFTTIPAPLPLHRSQISERRPIERFASRIKHFRINSKMAGTIRNVARKYRSTPFHIYLAAFKVLLYRFLGITDVCIGIVDSGRRDEETQLSIGPYLNTLPLRMNASAKQKFSDAIVEAREKSISVLSNPLPLELILKETQTNRASTHTPLAQAFMNYAETNIPDGHPFLGCEMSALSQDQAELVYDIAFTVINQGVGETHIWMNVQETLYTEDDAAFLAHGYEDILEEFITTPSDAVGDEWRFRKSALKQALTAGKGPAFNSTWPQTLVHRFEDVAQMFPSNVAVKDTDGNSLTYSDLHRHADTIASELLCQKVEPGSRVAVYQHSSIHWAASVLAIMKVGGVYVPLDVSNPPARLALIVDNSQPKAILIHGPTESMTKGLGVASGTAFIDVSRLSNQRADVVSNLAQADSPAIILYTSGSTGTPKGVIIRHSALKHEMDFGVGFYGFQENDVVLQQSAWSFDLSSIQLFVTLGVGATLQMAPHLMRADARAMVELIKNEGVTTTLATPTEYKSWMRRGNQALLQTSSWRLALFAGELVTESLLELFRHMDFRGKVFNIYGPTETTCTSAKMELDFRTAGLYQGAIPAGRISANESVYILDKSQRLLPCGQAGEVVIGGMGVTMGYLNDDERTRASFLPDPYADDEYVKNDWKTMYRTGDFGFLQQDGVLVVHGRIEGDTEIKLNGVRINLADVEQTVLKASNGVLSDAVTTLRSDPDGQVKFMVVHVVFSSDNSNMDKNDYLHSLLEDLPLSRMMRPSAIIPIDEFPRTVSGKIDRKAVARLSIPNKLQSTEEPSLSKAEAVMLSLWEAVIPEEIFGLHQVNGDTDFFAAGGGSMSLIELQHKIQEKQGVLFPLLQLFQASTLRGMAGLLGMEEAGSGHQIDWDAETAVQPGLDSLSESLNMGSPRTPPRVIVLTGASGFLGQHLMRGIAAQKHVEKVICIAIRKLNEKQSIFSGIDKVECYEGDLRKPRLGLSEKAANMIFQHADTVVHNAAEVSHLRTYFSLSQANFGSTQALVKLCLPRKIPMHFVSSASVSMYTKDENFPEASVRDSFPPVDGQYGYAACKWASEVYLENVHATYGLPVYIHRPTSILRPDEDIKGGDAVDDVMQGMLAYSERIRAVPVGLNLHGTLDIVRPETVTSKLVRAVMAQREDRVIYIHESGDLVLRDTELAKYLAKRCGETVDEIPLEEWIPQAQAAGLSDTLVAVFQGAGRVGNMNFPRVLTN
ncbi:beta-ketoacyl synthase domain-containing protein [Ilyonectria destructans]|nr:beta-ketoacyl synthase domain-containing protein [Ilyonectria destructans]